VEFNQWVGVYCFLGMLLFIFLGIPVYLCMFGAALIGFWLVGGVNFLFTTFTNGPYSVTAGFTFAVVPMFIVMGELASVSGIAEAAYTAASKWLSAIRGGVIMATVAAAALFGAVSGSSTASSAVFTKMAMPELSKYNFDKRLCLGCITASGALSSIIPPSIPIIIFCVLSNISVGKALIGGIVPGIVLAIAFCVMVYIISFISPGKVPYTVTHVTWSERFSSLLLIWPVAILFLLVIGGMYLGIFPPTVGGAIGAAGALIYAIVRKVKKKRLYHSFWETVLLNAQIFPLIISGFMFGRFIALTGMPTAFINMIANSHLPALLIMLAVVIVYIVLGCVLEIFSMLIITIPIIFPVLTSVGFDPTAVCIILVFLCEISNVTPPIGLGAFIVASAAKVDPMEVFKGAVPFLIVEMIILWVCILIPPVVTWLPNVFY
jgi:C4-dicarboxylate transporter, DctM subunit